MNFSRKGTHVYKSAQLFQNEGDFSLGSRMLMLVMME